MQILAKGNESITRFCRREIRKDLSYRLMRYHVREDCDAGTLLLNTVSGEMVLLDCEEKKLLDGLPSPYTVGMDELIEHCFLVAEAFDDLRFVDQLRAILRRFEATDAITGYTILPTTCCNARCFYCYESNEPHYSMTPETADKVISYIESHCGSDKKVSLHWFGGEPTLGEQRIDQICDGLTQKGIDYKSTMISNGFLFSKAMAEKAQEKWHLKSIQITLDGTEAVYNRTKAYVHAEGSPYQRVLENIAHLLDHEVRVSVRMNLDFHNADDLRALIDALTERFGDRKGFSAYVHELFENEGFDPVSHSLEEKLHLYETKEFLNDYIKGKGCRNSGSIKSNRDWPELKRSYCMADNRMSILINPLGQFGKCEHILFTRLIGDIDQGHSFDSPNGRYWLKPNYSEACQPCQLYPHCGQIDYCETKSVCFTDQVRKDKIDSIRMKMRNRFEGGQYNEEARS